MSERIIHVIPNLQMKKYERKAVGIYARVSTAHSAQLHSVSLQLSALVQQVYQEMREKYGYTRSYGGFKRIVARLKTAKGNKRRKARKNKPYQRAEYPGQKGSGGREVRACRVCGGWRKILPVHGCGRVHTLDLSADVR